MINPYLRCLAVCLILLKPGHAQDYEGADKVLELLRTQEGESLDPVGLLKKQIASFKAESGKLTPDVAARRWLELFDAFVKIPRGILYKQDYYDRLDLNALIVALPPTAAWEPLTVMIAERQAPKDGANAALNLLLWTLRGSPGGVTDVLENVRLALEDNDRWMRENEHQRESQLDKLAGYLWLRTGRPVNEIEAFRKELEMKEEDHDSGWGYLNVPQLAGVTPDAEALLTRALKCDLQLGISDEATAKLAAKLVLANPEILRVPQWRLVTSAADAPLYEVMLKRFPKDGERSDRHQVAGYYVISLIVAGKTEEARKLLFSEISSQPRSYSDGVIPSIDDNDPETVKKVRQFLADLLVIIPELPLWEKYIQLSVIENSTTEAIALIRTTLEKMQENSYLLQATEEPLLKSYLAAGEVEPAVKMIRNRIKSDPGEMAEMGDREKAAMQKRLESLGVEVSPELVRVLSKPEESANDRMAVDFQLALKLAELGRLMENPEWVNEGLSAAVSMAGSLRPDTWSVVADIDGLITALVKNGRGPEAETIVAERLLKLRAIKDKSTDDVRSNLASLVYIYRQAERPADIVKLLDTCDFWDADDLSDLEDVRFNSYPLQLMAAEALASVGKTDVALQLVNRILRRNPGDDAVYQLLLTLNVPDVEVLLDQIYATNRFEERPLVWQAKVQLDAGRVDEAEKTIRAAIAIDPSDGEQGKGDRMRAYSVLAEILEKKGDAEQAKVMRGAVEAIRISEDADDWWSAGLTKRAVEMYQEALDHFADAYCIQSRLALRYSELGDAVNAEKHYQRAFELMPSSFGRVESHCFGCEGIFSRENSQGVADRVFSRLAKEMPDRAQVFYLLGFLRESQGRTAEAIVEFRRAVELDPEYINAWRKIVELSDSNLSTKERDEAALTLFKLGGGDGSLRQAVDLVSLWDTVLELESTSPKPLAGPVYPLASSKADPGESQRRSYYSRNPEAMREQMTSNNIIQGLNRIMQLLLNEE